MKKRKQIPRFKSEAEKAECWASQNSMEYVDYSKGQRIVFPNLIPSTKTISIRLPESLIEHIKFLASKRDIPYQSRLKMFLSEKVKEELHGATK